MVILGILFRGFVLKNYLDTHNSIMKGVYIPKRLSLVEYLLTLFCIIGCEHVAVSRY